MERQRRRPSLERSIGALRPDDFRVRVLGIVVDTDPANQTAVIDDGTGRALAYFPDPDQFQEIQEGGRVRILGKVQPGEEIGIEVEVLQDMDSLDMGLYNQVHYVTEKR
jgi:hypothetical protein